MSSQSHQQDQPVTRRDFVKGLAGAGATLALAPLAQAAETLAPATKDKLPERLLGKTGQSVTILGLGNAALLVDGPKDQAVGLIERALELGVNYIDTHRGYGGGRSEQCLGQVLRDPAKRRKVFLCTKILHGEPRTRDFARRSLEASLRNLCTDYVDLFMAASIDRNADVDQVLADDGSIRAMQEAQQQGLVRFLGFSAHHAPEPVVYALERFPFDAVLLSINAADPHYKSLIRGALPIAQKHNVGIIAMKVAAAGRFLGAGISMTQALRYSLSQPGVATAIVGCQNIAQLEENVRLACEYQPMDAQSQEELVVQARQAADANCNYWQLKG